MALSYRTGLAGRRRDRHDTAPPRCDHVRKSGLQAQERAGEVDGQIPIPLVEPNLVEAGEPSNRRTGDQDLDWSELVPHRLEGACDPHGIGYINLHRGCGRAAGREVGRNLLGRLGVDIEYRDPVALARQVL